jgi:hypothetical protein
VNDPRHSKDARIPTGEADHRPLVHLTREPAGSSTAAANDVPQASRAKSSPRVASGAKTHYAASLMSAADQPIPDDTRMVLEELITETGR